MPKQKRVREGGLLFGIGFLAAGLPIVIHQEYSHFTMGNVTGPEAAAGGMILIILALWLFWSYYRSSPIVRQNVVTYVGLIISVAVVASLFAVLGGPFTIRLLALAGLLGAGHCFHLRIIRAKRQDC